MDLVVGTYIAYLIISIPMTIWVASTLHKNGNVFLIKMFNDNTELAHSVNHLLVVGFYLINLGWVSLCLKLGYDVTTYRQSIEALAEKIGVVLLILGVMHLFNLFLFGCIRLGSKPAPHMPPVNPDGFTEFGA